MPEMKLGTHSNAWNQVLRALEWAAGLPPASGGGDIAWMKGLLDRINQTKGTDIKYSRESYGYIFTYGKVESAALIGEIKNKYGL